MYDLLLKRGNVVFPDGIKRCDVAVKDGRIAAIGEGLGAAEQVVHLEGQYLFPGGIDVHVHLNEPGNEEWEGFETGTHLLAAGGITSFFDMPLNADPPTITVEALEMKKALAQQKARIQPYYWGGLVHDNVDQLEALAEEGVIGFKAFLSNTGFEPFSSVQDGTLLKGMKEIARLGKILALHAESDELTGFLQQQKIGQGAVSAKDYGESRPILAEVEAVRRALYYAEMTGCRLHFVHISSAEAVMHINEAKKRGLDVSLETCPHYLLFDDAAYEAHGVLAKCAPPLRPQEEQKALIRCLKEGSIDMVASDHSPCLPDMKDLTGKHFFQAWGGISGGQFTLLGLLDVCKVYDIPLQEAAKWLCENPAKRFGLERKGRIEVGCDADFAIVAEQAFTVTKGVSYAKHKDSIYNGWTFSHTIMASYSYGKCVFRQPVTETQYS